MLNCRLACLSLEKGIIFSFFLGADRTVTQSILVYLSAQISPTGHSTDLQRHVLIQGAPDKLFLVVSSLDRQITAVPLAEANAECQNKDRGKEAWLNWDDDRT